MKSKFWVQSFGEIVDNPDDYKSQELFLKEASSILDEIYKHYNKHQKKFSEDDRSVKKAIWMLHLDALDTLRDCIFLMLRLFFFELSRATSAKLNSFFIFLKPIESCNCLIYGGKHSTK